MNETNKHMEEIFFNQIKNLTMETVKKSKGHPLGFEVY